MPRRKSHQSELKVFKPVVTDAYASVSCMSAAMAYEWEPASTVLTIDGRLDRPVLRMETVRINVHRGDYNGKEVGAALGISSIWQVIVYLPDPVFSDLRTIILAGKLNRVRFVMASVKRGVGKVASMDFFTRADDDE